MQSVEACLQSLEINFQIKWQQKIASNRMIIWGFDSKQCVILNSDTNEQTPMEFGDQILHLNDRVLVRK